MGTSQTIRAPHPHQPKIPKILRKQKTTAPDQSCRTPLTGDATYPGHLGNITLSNVGRNPELKNELHKPSKRTDRHTYIYNEGHLALLGFWFVLGTDKGAEPSGYAALTSSTAHFLSHHLFLLSLFQFRSPLSLRNFYSLRERSFE